MDNVNEPDVLSGSSDDEIEFLRTRRPGNGDGYM